MTDEQWRAWLAAPLTLADELAVELRELRQVPEVGADARHQAMREDAARRRPTYAELCERRGETARAARAREQQARIEAAFA
jgi:hypothetical protein